MLQVFRLHIKKLADHIKGQTISINGRFHKYLNIETQSVSTCRFFFHTNLDLSSEIYVSAFRKQ